MKNPKETISSFLDGDSLDLMKVLQFLGGCEEDEIEELSNELEDQIVLEAAKSNGFSTKPHIIDVELLESDIEA